MSENKIVFKDAFGDEMDYVFYLERKGSGSNVEYVNPYCCIKAVKGNGKKLNFELHDNKAGYIATFLNFNECKNEAFKLSKRYNPKLQLGNWNCTRGRLMYSI